MPSDNVFVSGHPLIQHKLAILRNKHTEPKKFRELIREISILLAYEATSDLGLAPITVETPMGNAAMQGTDRDDRSRARAPRRVGHGRRHLGDDAGRRGVAPRALPR